MSRSKARAATATAVVALSLAGVRTAAGATDSDTTQCRVADVTVGYHDAGAGMSHRFGRITLTNTSGRSCWVQGYGGLSYVGGDDGTQVGAAATRTPGATPRTVLGPGDRVSSQVSATITAPYSRAVCRPAHVDGFRVYLPDETHAVFVSYPATGCQNPDVHLLFHQAYR